MKRSSKTVLTVLCTILGAAGLAEVAGATMVSGDHSDSCHVSGFLTVHDDETEWSLKITDTSGEGYGAYAKIVFDRDDHSDNEVRSSKTDSEGETLSWTGSKKYGGTRGAKLYACVDRRHRSDNCTQIEHVKED